MTVQRSNEPEVFLAFEREGWNTVIQSYERIFAPLTAQTVEPLLDAAGVGPRSQVLDVCCGHGVLAAAARRRGAEVIGLDFSPEALGLARRNAPVIDFVEGDAQALPYDESTFDAVVCGYGIIHVPAPDRALAEMHRVLKPGGRVAVSVWQRPTPGSGFGAIVTAIQVHGRQDLQLPHGPDFFQFSDPEAMRAALAEAGFTDVRTFPVAQSWRLQHPGDLADAILQGGVRLRAILRAQDPAALAEIRAAIEEQMVRSFAYEDGYAVPMPAIVGVGRKAAS